MLNSLAFTREFINTLYSLYLNFSKHIFCFLFVLKQIYRGRNLNRKDKFRFLFSVYFFRINILHCIATHYVNTDTRGINAPIRVIFLLILILITPRSDSFVLLEIAWRNAEKRSHNKAMCVWRAINLGERIEFLPLLESCQCRVRTDISR